MCSPMNMILYACYAKRAMKHEDMLSAQIVCVLHKNVYVHSFIFLRLNIYKYIRVYVYLHTYIYTHVSKIYLN